VQLPFLLRDKALLQGQNKYFSDKGWSFAECLSRFLCDEIGLKTV